MSKKPLLIALMAVLFLSACETTNTQITGVATIGLFGGTEKGCAYGDVGSTFECNTGSGTIYLETSEGSIYLKDYRCSAGQFFVNDETGKHVEYRASSECDGDIMIGEIYTATGELVLEEDVWRNGTQVDEQWLTVDSIILAE